MDTTKQKLQSWKKSMIKSAKENWMSDKELMPVAILYTEDDGNLIVPLPFTNQSEKEMYSDKVKSLVREHKVIAVVFIHEGYMKHFKEKDKNVLDAYQSGNISVKDMDGRIETIIIVFETKSGEKELTTIEIKGNELGEEKLLEGNSSGLFANFFATPTWVN